MTNLAALTYLCNAIVSTFYPDESTLNVALFNAEVNPDAQAIPKDVALFRVAVALVKGYVETSRTENGVSASADQSAIEKSLRHWCAQYGLDADEELGDCITSLEDGSNFW